MKYNLSPHHPKVVQAAIEVVRQMTPEEALAFLKYRTPGIEETDMTGMLPMLGAKKDGVMAPLEYSLKHGISVRVQSDQTSSEFATVWECLRLMMGGGVGRTTRK